MQYGLNTDDFHRGNMYKEEISIVVNLEYGFLVLQFLRNRPGLRVEGHFRRLLEHAASYM